MSSGRTGGRAIGCSTNPREAGLSTPGPMGCDDQLDDGSRSSFSHSSEELQSSGSLPSALDRPCQEEEEACPTARLPDRPLRSEFGLRARRQSIGLSEREGIYLRRPLAVRVLKEIHPAPGNRHPHPLITTPTSSLEIELHTTHRPSWHRDDHSSSPVHEVCSLTAVASTRREPAFCLSMDELTRHFPPRSCVGRPAASPTGQNDWCTSNVRRLCSQFSLASTASSRSLQHVVPAGPAGPGGPRGRVPCVQGQPEDH